MTQPLARRTTWLAGIASASLATAAPAFATEANSGPALPNPLAPITFTPAGSTAGPGAPRPNLPVAVRPRIQRLRLVPRRVVRGHRSRLSLTLSTPMRVRVVLERTRGRRHARVRVFNVPAGRRNVSLRLPANLKLGRYRVRVVAIDALGNKSRELRRALTVVRRAR